MQAIRRWILATFILSFLVIIAGGVVRTTQSGMGCPDWPKCFGRWIPPTNASQLPADFEKYLKKQDIDHTFNVWHTWIEYINRLLGALLGLFGVIQAASLFFRRRTMRRSFRLALAFLMVVILTGLFGAIVVKLNLAHLSISVHLFFALLLLWIQAALYLSFRQRLFTVPTPVRIRNLLLLLTLLLLVQGSLGTLVRMYVDEISKSLQYGQRDQWLADIPVAFIIHRSFSWLALIAALYTGWKAAAIPGLRRSVYFLVAWVMLNMIVGIVLFYADMPAIAQPIHLLLATAALVQGAMVWLLTRNAALQTV
jgi:heme a synthase